jgi:hypothetical protein
MQKIGSIILILFLPIISFNQYLDVNVLIFLIIIFFLIVAAF